LASKADKLKKLQLAERHLERVLGASLEPDWDTLVLFGFYCVEAAVASAAMHFGMETSRKHWEKADVAARLHRDHKLPDVADLLMNLNEARKAAAYGDVEAPEFDAEDLAGAVEEYVHAVAALVRK